MKSITSLLDPIKRIFKSNYGITITPERKLFNQIMVIKPYKVTGTSFWAFDDPIAGLHQELFVAGMPEIIETVLREQNIDIKKAEDGFMLIFSKDPFPGCQGCLNWSSGSPSSGNFYTYYTINGVIMEGWLCPALFKYFDKAPKKIYFQFTELINY